MHYLISALSLCLGLLGGLVIHEMMDRSKPVEQSGCVAVATTGGSISINGDSVYMSGEEK